MSLFFRQEPERNKHDKLVAPKYATFRALTASTESINTSSKDDVTELAKRRSASTWQTKAWDYSEVIGEVHYASAMIGNVLSRIRLYPGFITDEDLSPADIQDVKDISDDLKADARRVLRNLSNGSGGMSGFLRDAGTNFFITGECYLVNNQKRSGDRQWEIRSVDEVVVSGSSEVSIKNSRHAQTSEYTKLKSANQIGRMWVSYPRYSDEADSSLRPLVELFDELLMWHKAVRIALKSAMNGGILFLPDELDKAAETFDDGDDDADINPDAMSEVLDDDDDAISEALLEAISAPIRDEHAASSIKPLILRGPEGAGEKIRHIMLSRDMPEKFQARADKVLERIISGLDVPSDIVSGMGGLKYSNAAVIEDSFYKNHIEPLALLIVDSLTSIYLRPALRAMGYTDEDLARVVIWFDPSAVSTKPSKAESATSGYDKHLISGEAWRRSHDFSESDAPTETEIAQRLALERGLLNDQVTEALLQTLIPSILGELRGTMMTPGASAIDSLMNPADPNAINGEGPLVTNPKLVAPDPHAPTTTPPTGLMEP